MIGLIAIIIGFVGGVVGRAWKFENAHHRLVAFFVPLTICALLLHVPLLMDAAHTGFGGANAEKLNVWRKAQMFIVVLSFLVTGAGWGYASCIEADFERELKLREIQ